MVKKMSKNGWSLIALAILALIIGYSYVTVSNGPIQPLGRLAFVKLANPDMYPGHPHSQLIPPKQRIKDLRLHWYCRCMAAPITVVIKKEMYL